MNKSLDQAGPVVETLAQPLLNLLPGIFMIVFLGLGLLMALATPATRHWPEETVWDGRWAATYEDAFKQALPLREVGVGAWGAIQYGLFREGRSGILVGRDGWLFTSEEFAWQPKAVEEIEDKLELVLQVNEALERRGIRLVVALIPAKAHVYQEQLGRYRLPSYALERYASFRTDLEARGIPAPDLMQALFSVKAEEPAFLKTDTHWSPEGAEGAAKALAAAISSLELELGGETFETQVSERAEPYQGDLLNFIPLGPFQAVLGPRPDIIYPHTTVAAEAAAQPGLFDAVTVPVALVGTSYSANPLWNFGGALKDALDADVLNISSEGRGPFLPMLEYLSSATLAESPPQLVIWEIPERYLPVALDEDGGI